LARTRNIAPDRTACCQKLQPVLGSDIGGTLVGKSSFPTAAHTKGYVARRESVFRDKNCPKQTQKTLSETYAMEVHDIGIDWWTPHGSEFSFKWSGQRLFYRGKAADATRVWEPSSSHLTNVLSTKDALLRFVRNGLESPDENTAVTFSDSSSEIKIRHESRLLPTVQVVVCGTEMTDTEEKMRFTMERVDGHQNEIQTLAGETADLRFSVGELQETCRKLEEELKFTIARLGGEKAVVVRGKVLRTDQVREDRELHGLNHYCHHIHSRDPDTPVFLKAIKPIYLAFCVRRVESELRVHLFNRNGVDIGSLREVIDDIRDEIKELRIHFDVKDNTGIEFKFPSFPKLLELTLHKVPFKNTDYLDNIAKTCKVLLT
jgi:uncharacterized protein YoxC